MESFMGDEIGALLLIFLDVVTTISSQYDLQHL